MSFPKPRVETNGAAKTETIRCHDCGRDVSFTALACPGCGSREPAGPVQQGAKELRNIRREERNDRNMIRGVLAGGVIGAIYGLATTTTTFGAIIACTAYGLVGMAIGAPVAFVLSASSLLFASRRK